MILNWDLFCSSLREFLVLPHEEDKESLGQSTQASSRRCLGRAICTSSRCQGFPLGMQVAGGQAGFGIPWVIVPDVPPHQRALSCVPSGWPRLLVPGKADQEIRQPGGLSTWPLSKQVFMTGNRGSYPTWQVPHPRLHLLFQDFHPLPRMGFNFTDR